MVPGEGLRFSCQQIKGGQAKSERKTAANRLKARLGGRPRKDGTRARPRSKPEEMAGIPSGQGVKPEEFEVGNS